MITQTTMSTIELDQTLARRFPYCCVQSSSREQCLLMPTWQRDPPLVCIPKEWMEQFCCPGLSHHLLLLKTTPGSHGSAPTLRTVEPWLFSDVFHLSSFLLSLEPRNTMVPLPIVKPTLTSHPPGESQREQPLAGHPQRLTRVLCSEVGLPHDVARFWKDGDVIQGAWNQVLESDGFVRTVCLVRAILGLYVQGVGIVRRTVRILPLQLHFSCGDLEHTDVKDGTGVWVEERKRKGSLSRTIIMPSLISKCQENCSFAIKVSNEFTKGKLQNKWETHTLISFRDFGSCITQTNAPIHPVSSLVFCFCPKNTPFGGLLQWKSHSDS